MTVFHSCDIDIKGEKTAIISEGHIKDIFSEKVLAKSKVKVVENWSSPYDDGETYQRLIDSTYSDATGYYIIKFNSYEGYWYTLRTSMDKYCTDEIPVKDVETINHKNIYLFPVGFLKTHLTNKTNSAQNISMFFANYWPIEIDITERLGLPLINNSLYLEIGLADTTILSTVVGGVWNRLSITYSFNASGSKVDTSFFSLKHDTVNLKIILR